ncbi:MAG: SMC family ATPase [Lachnospiraceae bacterium]|nr:SMC family ATPase [Lachnospiraceae bacterium]
MKPLKIEFQAFGPYAGHETVDFRELSENGLFLIFGKTGSGKTMILDAMTIALYGKSSGHGRDDFQSLRCTGADFDTPTFVRFEFEKNGEYYCFERRLTRKRKNLSASYNLMKKDENGDWQTLLENPKEHDLNQRAEELVGLPYEQFRQVIVLPQGQFERLLTSSSEEKEKILSNIFGEERWQEIAAFFYSEAEDRRNLLKERKERIAASLREEGCGSLKELQELIEEKREDIKILDREAESRDFDRAIIVNQELLTIIKRFSDLHKAEKNFGEILDREKETAALENRLKDGKRADNLRPRLSELKDAEIDLKKRKAETFRNGTLKEEKEAGAREASEALMQHAEKEGEIEEKKKLRILCEEKRKDYEGLEEAVKELKDAEKLKSEAGKEEEAALKEYESHADRTEKIRREYESLESEHTKLLNSYIAGITGVLAAELKEGEPCPVCGSTEHPKKAAVSSDQVSKAEVDKAKRIRDRKYKELEEETALSEKSKGNLEERRAECEKAARRIIEAETHFKGLKKNLVPGIGSLRELENKITELSGEEEVYLRKKEELLTREKESKLALTEISAALEAAVREENAAEEKYTGSKKAAEKTLKENGFSSKEEAEKLLLSPEETEEISSAVRSYYASKEAAENNLKELKMELRERTEPDEEKCRRELDAAISGKSEYKEKRAVIISGLERLEKKLKLLKEEGEGIEEALREAEEDFIFAKRLRGDSGTGLQRYVLGIMFSSVISAANSMLEMVHGGRYRLFRSDDKARGTNKKGLELKVFDRNSGEKEGRFVGTLSGGEKFLVSLALSIGMSIVAGKSGIRIEALFIDEGFGTLDSDSIGDAMNVLNSVQEAHGLVGIISHVQMLEDQIPVKLRIMQGDNGSHILRTLG